MTTAIAESLLKKREELSESLRGRLAAHQIDVTTARDGVRDCFVSTYLGGVERGLDNLGLQGNIQQLTAVTERMLRDRLKKHGASWEQPSTEALELVKRDLDTEMHFDALPAQLQEVHNNVCELLLAKASGLMEHRGDASVISQRGKKTSDPVTEGLRNAIAGQLDAMRKDSLSGATVDKLYAGTKKLMKLVDTLAELS